jgi:SAM-dependent methyltransferase
VNKKLLKLTAQRTLPTPIQHWLKTQWQAYRHHPLLGGVRLGELRSLKPISSDWGFERGQPIDRYYIENFLARQSDDIRGRVLAVGDDFYTRQFGGERITKSDVLHIEEGSPEATIIGDLTDAEHIPSDTFDCFILAQTLQLIYEVRLAIKTTYRIMKPGGVVLVTIPGITPLKDHEWNDCWCWSFTALSAQRLFEEFFPKANIEVQTYGNVLAATAFLQGMATRDLQRQHLDYHDPSYQMLITVRAVKPEVV